MKADQEGFIDTAKFNKMIELAADAPRKFGFAPSASETYPDEQAQMTARSALFKEILAKNKRGMTDKISYKAWLDWAYTHICEKAMSLNPELDGKPPKQGDLANASYGGAKARSKLGAHRGISAQLASSSKEMFIKFVRGVAESKQTPEYQELHYFLMEAFVECDLDFDGLIMESDFENLVERAGALPRECGGQCRPRWESTASAASAAWSSGRPSATRTSR